MTTLNINDLTMRQAKELVTLFNGNAETDKGLNKMMLGKSVIIRTYAAGVWFGLLAEKSGGEVILADARRMWRWQAMSGISLSSCAIHGIDHKNSKIVEAVESVWLEAIEIIPCTERAIGSLRGAENVKAG